MIPTRLPPREVHIWWADRRAASTAMESLLDDVERARLSSYRRREDRELFLVACALAKVAIGGYVDRRAADIRFVRTCSSCGKPHGKPRLDEASGSAIEFSVSHSGDRTVVALAMGTPVGVDVERIDRRLDVGDVAAATLSRRETVAPRARSHRTVRNAD
jgi:4'-phosphopantetheinyl transferase